MCDYHSPGLVPRSFDCYFFPKVASKYVCNKYSTFHLTDNSAGVLSSLGVLLPFGVSIF
jgi:hypothetical protein